LLPSERGDAVRRLRAEGERVAAIGWPSEDHAALGAADAAIAIGAVGRDAGSLAVIIADGHLREAAAALWLARTLRDQVTRAVAAAIATFVLVVVGASVGLITPAAATLLCIPAELYALGASARLLRRFALMLPARG
jgi:Cu+-exporting ATPase